MAAQAWGCWSPIAFDLELPHSGLLEGEGGQMVPPGPPRLALSFLICPLLRHVVQSTGEEILGPPIPGQQPSNQLLQQGNVTPAPGEAGPVWTHPSRVGTIACFQVYP